MGRFLEHSRIFNFTNGGDDEVYIGSADLMLRNLKHRIEVVAPVREPALKSYLKDVVLNAYLRDNVKARELRPDGSYLGVTGTRQDETFSSQTFFIGHSADNWS